MNPDEVITLLRPAAKARLTAAHVLATGYILAHDTVDGRVAVVMFNEAMSGQIAAFVIEPDNPERWEFIHTEADYRRLTGGEQ